jgi:hypothetical protein
MKKAIAAATQIRSRILVKRLGMILLTGDVPIGRELNIVGCRSMRCFTDGVLANAKNATPRRVASIGLAQLGVGVY